MNESELYKELGALTKDKDLWEEGIPYVSSLLAHESVKIQAKALWLLGEMGLAYPQSVEGATPAIAALCDSPAPLLRERAVNALGRIGRGNYSVIEPYWAGLFHFASDEEPKVRLAFIWASENIATSTPDIYAVHMSVFAELLHDADDKVRMEAPEIFRVLGKRRPGFVRPYLEQLRQISETDGNRVVRIHCLGAIKAAGSDQTIGIGEGGKNRSMQYTHHYHSPLGGITEASDGERLTGLWFDGQKYFADTLGPDHEEKELPVFKQTDTWLDIYFSGKEPGFTPPLGIHTTEFRKSVWEIMLTIPFGKTVTYGEIVKKLAEERGAGRISAQAVGGAVGHNSISLIIPCHRVVGANGSLTGYAGGIEKKKQLLRLEGVDTEGFYK